MRYKNLVRYNKLKNCDCEHSYEDKMFMDYMQRGGKKLDELSNRNMYTNIRDSRGDNKTYVTGDQGNYSFYNKPQYEGHEPSTHLMADDNEKQAWASIAIDEDGNWFNQDYEKAKSRGEVYTLDNRDEMIKFAREGSWKLGIPKHQIGWFESAKSMVSDAYDSVTDTVGEAYDTVVESVEEVIDDYKDAKLKESMSAKQYQELLDYEAEALKYKSIAELNSEKKPRTNKNYIKEDLRPEVKVDNTYVDNGKGNFEAEKFSSAKKLNLTKPKDSYLVRKAKDDINNIDKNILTSLTSKIFTGTANYLAKGLTIPTAINEFVATLSLNEEEEQYLNSLSGEERVKILNKYGDNYRPDNIYTNAYQVINNTDKIPFGANDALDVKGKVDGITEKIDKGLAYQYTVTPEESYKKGHYFDYFNQNANKTVYGLPETVIKTGLDYAVPGSGAVLGAAFDYSNDRVSNITEKGVGVDLGKDFVNRTQDFVANAAINGLSKTAFGKALESHSNKSLSNVLNKDNFLTEMVGEVGAKPNVLKFLKESVQNNITDYGKETAKSTVKNLYNALVTGELKEFEAENVASILDITGNVKGELKDKVKDVYDWNKNIGTPTYDKDGVLKGSSIMQKGGELGIPKHQTGVKEQVSKNINPIYNKPFSGNYDPLLSKIGSKINDWYQPYSRVAQRIISGDDKARPGSDEDTIINIPKGKMKFFRNNEVPLDSKVILGGDYLEDRPTAYKASEYPNEMYTLKGETKKIDFDNQIFYGIKDGNIVFQKRSDFNDNDVVVPLRENFGGEYSIGEDSVVKDTMGDNLNTYGSKVMLFSPSTNEHMFVYKKNTKDRDKALSDFKKNNPDANYLILDNGRFGNYQTNEDGINQKDVQEYYRNSEPRGEDDRSGYNFAFEFGGQFGIPKHQTGVGYTYKKGLTTEQRNVNPNLINFLTDLTSRNSGLDLKKVLNAEDLESLNNIVITGGRRSKKGNSSTKGSSKNSKHLTGDALDLRYTKERAQAFIKMDNAGILSQYGINLYRDFHHGNAPHIHISTDINGKQKKVNQNNNQGNTSFATTQQDLDQINSQLNPVNSQRRDYSVKTTAPGRGVLPTNLVSTEEAEDVKSNTVNTQDLQRATARERMIMKQNERNFMNDLISSTQVDRVRYGQKPKQQQQQQQQPVFNLDYQPNNIDVSISQPIGELGGYLGLNNYQEGGKEEGIPFIKPLDMTPQQFVDENSVEETEIDNNQEVIEELDSGNYFPESFMTYGEGVRADKEPVQEYVPRTTKNYIKEDVRPEVKVDKTYVDNGKGKFELEVTKYEPKELTYKDSDGTSDTSDVSVYKVQSGDSLSKIAKKNGKTLNEILELNPKYKSNPNLIFKGDDINLGSQSEGSRWTGSQGSMIDLSQYNPLEEGSLSYKDLPQLNEQELTDVQKTLDQLGFDIGSYGADGKYGKSTQKAYDEYKSLKNTLVDLENDTDIIKYQDKLSENGLFQGIDVREVDEKYVRSDGKSPFMVNPKKISNTKHCTRYIGNQLTYELGSGENEGDVYGRQSLNAYGNAWQITGRIMNHQKGGKRGQAQEVYSIFEDEKPSGLKSRKQIEGYIEDRIKKSKGKLDASKFRKGDLVNIYYPESTSVLEAYEDGSKYFTTHLGQIKEGKDGKLYVEHNIGIKGTKTGTIYKVPLQKMIDGRSFSGRNQRPMQISAVIRPDYQQFKTGSKPWTTESPEGVRRENLTNKNSSMYSPEYRQFKQTLDKNKESLKKDIGVTESEFSKLSRALRAIAYKESEYGEADGRFKIKMMNLAGEARESVGGTEKSRGMTRLKDSKNLTDNLKGKYIEGKGENLDDPSQSVIPSAYALGARYKYLKTQNRLNGYGLTEDQLAQLSILAWNENIATVSKSLDKYKTFDNVIKAYRTNTETGKVESHPYDLALEAYRDYLK